MKCPHCSADVVADAAFCGACGQPITAPTVPGQPAQVEAPPVADSLPVAGAPRPPRHLAPGTLVDGKYAIERVLGEGGMGVVYVAKDVNTGVRLVLKAVRAELADRSDVRERTLAEGRALAQIDHPNVVHLNAVVPDVPPGRGLWLVMQYVEGESLDQALARYAAQGQRMPVAEVLSIFRQVLGGVGAAHRLGLIHRDLKPGNVLLRARDGVAKVGDFGIVKLEEDARAGRGVTKGIVGSLWYMSPEQVTGRRDLDKRVDIYALGILLYEMLVGEVPFDAASDVAIMTMHAKSPLPKVTAKRPEVPTSIDDVLARATAKDRDQRIATCEDFLAALDAAVRVAPSTTVDAAPRYSAVAQTGAPDARDHHGGVTGPGAVLPGAPPARPSRGWIAPTVLLVLVIAGGATAFSLGLVRLPGRGRHTSTPTSASAVATATPPTPPRTGLAALEGRWQSENGRDFDAVLSGDVLEFRVVDPKQFAPADYNAGEARFTLRALPGQSNVFAVEDRIRPLPPSGFELEDAARPTCQDVRVEANGTPLRATFDSDKKLSVDSAKIEPTSGNFVLTGGKVISCRGLSTLRAAKLVVQLGRAR